MDLLFRMPLLPVGKVKVGQGQLSAVRQMATHQQMVAKMGLRPVRRPEVAHHVIAEILCCQIKMVHRLPVIVVAELQDPVVALAQQTVQPVGCLLLLVGEQTNRRRQGLSAKTDVGNPALAVEFNQQQTMRTRRHLWRTG